MAQLSKTSHPGFMDQSGEKFEARFAREQRLLDELMAKAIALPDSEIIGGIVKFQIADGYAMYLVVKDKPLTLQHLAHGDGYQVDPALIRGLRRADIEMHLKREKAWSRLVPAFKAKRAER